MVKLPTFTCLRCNYTWTPRTPNPKRCPGPRCKSIYWGVPRTRIRKEKEA